MRLHDSQPLLEQAMLSQEVLHLSPKGNYGWSGAHSTHFWIDDENGLYGLFMTRLCPLSPPALPGHRTFAL